jgi:folylpolyglutamate synthase/dihydropteroate synthase
MENDGRAAGRPMHWVFSALRDKPAAEMVESLRGRFRSLHVCPLPSHRSRSITDLAALDRNATAYHNVAAALDGARDLAARDGGLVLASGSLLLAGDVLALLTHAPRDPATQF